MDRSVATHVQAPIPDRGAGVCAQDFETTIQSQMTSWHLRGLLNFSALWNRVTYIYDTAIGDNPHLINSFFGARPGDGLYTAFVSFVEHGVIRCLFRDKVTVEGYPFGVGRRVTA